MKVTTLLVNRLLALEQLVELERPMSQKLMDHTSDALPKQLLTESGVETEAELGKIYSSYIAAQF